MSRAQGIAYGLEGSHIGYFLYNGTTDIAYSRLFEKKTEAWEAKNASEIIECHCGGEPEESWLYASYGSGFYWLGQICRKCMVITGRHMPWDDAGNRPIKGRPYVVEFAGRQDGS